MLVTMDVTSRFLITFLIVEYFRLANCGRVKRVIGGKQVQCGVQPHVASLRNASSLQHLCGATVLSADYAVTAAHCVRSGQQYVLRFDNLCEEIPTPAVVLEVYVHKDYDKYSRAHDIAMLKVKLDSTYDHLESRNLLPVSSFGISGDCTIYGYGVRGVDSGVLSARLVAATVRVVSLDECLGKLGPFMAPDHDSGMMCVVGDQTDSCQGDSGGPLFCSGELQGVISHGMSCGVPDVPSVLTSIGAHRTWIDGVMNGL